MIEKNDIKHSYSKRKSLSFFYVLFLVISLIIISVIITTFVVFNNVYSRHLKEALNEANLKNLSQIKNSYVTMNDFVESFLFRLTNDLKAKQLIYTENTSENSYEINVLMKWMGSYRANTAFISSLYLYNNKAKIFYSIGNNNVIREHDEMYDEEIVEIIDSLDTENNQITLKPRIIPNSPYTKNKSKKVYTYILTKVNHDTEILEYVYVVNVESSWIEDNVLDISFQNLEEESELLIINSENEVLAHSDKSLFATKLDNINYIEYLNNSLNDREYLEWVIDDEEYFISYDKADDIYFINLTKNEVLYERIRLINRISLIITAVFLMLGLVLSYLISKVFYGPVIKLKNNMKELFNDKDKYLITSNNEFAFMNSMFKNVYEDYQELELFKSKNIRNIRHKILFDLLLNSDFNIEEFKRMHAEYNFIIDIEKRMQILVFSIDNYKKLIDENEKSLVQSMLYDILAETFERSFNAEIIHIEDSYLVLINISELKLKEDETVQGYIYKLVSDIQKKIVKLSGYTVSSAISTIAKDINYLHNTYKLTKDIMRYRFVKGYGCILTVNDLSVINEDFKLP